MTTRAFTLDFVMTLIAELNRRLGQEVPKVPEQIGETERQLADMEQVIGNLLDLAERFGAASAGPRISEREAERAHLQVRLRCLELQNDAREVRISPETVQRALTPMREALIEGDLPAKRDLLSKLVVKVGMGPKRSRAVVHLSPARNDRDVYNTPFGVMRRIPCLLPTSS